MEFVHDRTHQRHQARPIRHQISSLKYAQNLSMIELIRGNVDTSALVKFGQNPASRSRARLAH
jgi:hypothetical protein